jgi:hypothetical protein
MEPSMIRTIIHQRKPRTMKGGDFWGKSITRYLRVWIAGVIRRDQQTQLMRLIAGLLQLDI